MTEHCHYIEEVKLNKALPKKSYLSRLPAVKSLSKLGGLSFGSDVTETGNYIITKRFLDDPVKMIKKLFE